MPASAEEVMSGSEEEVMSGSEEEDAGALPMMHEDDDCNYWWDAPDTHDARGPLP